MSERLSQWGPFPARRRPTRFTVEQKTGEIEAAKKANPLFTLMIDMAIMVAIEDMRRRGEDYRLAFCHDAVDVIASAGDTVEEARKTKGETAAVFSVIARAVAALAYQPGGVRFLGTHYEAKE